MLNRSACSATRPSSPPALYAWRFHHEASFRDLKSDGFHWQCSRVWLPKHTERLLLVLACATLWVLTQGTQILFLFPLSARQKRNSVFRRGLDELFARLYSPRPLYLDFYLAPDTPTLKSVVT